MTILETYRARHPRSASLAERAALAAWAAYDKLLMPALRWFLAGRTNVVLEEVSTRLRISVRPFQRTRRQILIHRLLGDPKVQETFRKLGDEPKKDTEMYAEAVNALFRTMMARFVDLVGSEPEIYFHA